MGPRLPRLNIISGYVCESVSRWDSHLNRQTKCPPHYRWDHPTHWGPEQNERAEEERIPSLPNNWMGTCVSLLVLGCPPQTETSISSSPDSHIFRPARNQEEERKQREHHRHSSSYITQVFMERCRTDHFSWYQIYKSSFVYIMWQNVIALICRLKKNWLYLKSCYFLL